MINLSYKIVINETKLGFTASHFLTNHPTCGTIHGHNYGVTVSIEVKEGFLDNNYMVIDFHDLKKIILNIIEKLDHKLMIPENSNELEIGKKKDIVEVKVKPSDKTYIFPSRDIVFLPISATTAECLARFIFKEIQKELQIKEYNMIVRIHENRGCYSEYSE